ncbi:nuclear pore complex protein DDB_G0274915 [Sabethes cyaneus]|uniref:nuclear pore complex protein DDB_G0274915 n=1 Tax=Sabethes cyaneus TaxID=53552 RepID=UPI00237E4EB3|nr:nuclear pore complex protein DDB_G0274915 [Sabethes cyaneus]
MNHNNSSRHTSFTFANGGGLGGRAETSNSNLSRTLSSPMAESTHLDSSGIRGNLYGSPIRQNQQQATGVVKRKPTSPLQNRSVFVRSSGNLSPIASTSGLNRIDPLIYTDAQSRGLVSRLIKYHDKTQSPLNRSQSMTSLYNKPGQFPVVHLKKTEIKYSPRRNNSVTSVRIAPPEKSVFQANTRSNILRAGSLLIPAEPHHKMARTQQGEEIDAENRVIAPTAELETAPTKSVLDALKEISRKRINNEELDADRIKKQCKDLSEVDSGGGGIGGTGMKRTRELAGSASPPSQGSLDQQKKRLCSKNNDISSSLSSSLVMNTPKRAADTGPPRPGRLNVDQTFSTPAALLPTTVSRTVETGAAVKTVQVEAAPLPEVKTRVVEAHSPPKKQQQKQPRLTLFNKKYDETVVRPASTDSEDQGDEDDELGARISFIKPKDRLPVLNSDKFALKKVEKSKLSLILSCLSDDVDSENEASPTQSVMIAKDTIDAPSKVIEKKPEEVAAPKLSGISALMNSPIKDPGLGKIEPQKQTESIKIIETSKPSGGFSLGSSTVTPAAPAVVPQTPSKPVEKSFAFGTPTKPVEGTSSGGFSFGNTVTTPVKSDAPPSYNFPSTAKSLAPIQPISTSTVGNSPSAISKTTSTADTSVTNNLISFSPAPVTAIKPTAEKISFTAPPASPTKAPIPPTAVFGSGSGFSAFKPPNTSPTSAATTTTPAFGGTLSATTAPSTTVNTGTFAFDATASKPITTGPSSSFSFGAGASINPVTTVVTTTTPAAVSSNPAFDSFRTAAAPATTTAAPVFGSSTTAPTFGATLPTPAFGSNNTFGGFGATTNVTATSNVFGAASTTASAKPETKQPTFGQSSIIDSSFSFKAKPTTATAATHPSAPLNSSSSFSFGTSGNVTSNQQSANIFGSAIAKNTANSSANNNISNDTRTFGAIAASNSIPAATFGTVNNASSAAASQPSPFGTASSNSTTSSASVFGTPANNNTARGNTAFGAGPVFGSGSSNTNSTAPTAGAVFGNTSNSSPFGSTATMPSSATGMFGSAVASPTNNTNQNQAAPSGGAFSFGASSAAPAAASTTSKPFSFGGINNSNNNNSNVSSPPAAPLKSNSFSFSAGSNAVSPTATPLTGSSSTFSFGGAGTNSSANNVAAPNAPFGGNAGNTFSFSSNAASASNNVNGPNQAVVKPFSFGGTNVNQSAAPAPSGGIFGSGAPIAPVSSNPPPPAFNFSAGTNQPTGAFSFNSAAAAPVAPGGPFSMPNGAVAAPMFSIGTGGGNQLPPNRRPIRQATRRHK